MKVSQKRKIGSHVFFLFFSFFIFFLNFPNLDSILNIFGKKMTLIADVYLKLRTSEELVR